MSKTLRRMKMTSLLFASVFFVFNCSALTDLANQVTTAAKKAISSGGGGGGGHYCGDGTCDSGEAGWCSDCGAPVTTNCGNGVCEWQYGETPTSCATDCTGTVAGGSCGDGICDIAAGENSWCNGTVNPSNPSGLNDCAGQGYCGDGICQANLGENPGWCGQDCAAATVCGDGICDAGEAGWCTDCGAISYCGDGICNSATESGWCSDCGQVGYCGDGMCQANESNATCAIDCPLSAANDGICSAFEVVAAAPSADCPNVVGSPFAVSATWQSFTLAPLGQSIRVEYSVTAGTTYTVSWDDSFNGTATYTGDIWVNGWNSDGTQFIFAQDSGYTTPVTFTAVATGTVVFELNANWATGTVGFQVNTAAPAVFTTLTVNAGTYTTLNILNDLGENVDFAVTSGTMYTVWWDDAFQGSGTYTLDGIVDAIYGDYTTVFGATDSGYTVGQQFTATQTGNVYVHVAPWTAGSTGTVGVQVTSP